MIDIDTMPAGREMDALVAERVMGWTKQSNCWVGSDGFAIYYDTARFIPSHDIAAAWEVVEKMDRSNSAHPVELQQFDSIWHCNFNSSSGPWMGIAETAPLAICRAALHAVGANCPAS